MADTSELIQAPTTLDYTRESIKLSVSTKGVYTWEIKITGTKDGTYFDDIADFERLKAINQKLIDEYGAQNND